MERVRATLFVLGRGQIYLLLAIVPFDMELHSYSFGGVYQGTRSPGFP